MNLRAPRLFLFLNILLALVFASSAGAAPRIVGGDAVTKTEFAEHYSAVVSVQSTPLGVPESRLSGLPDAVTHQCTGVLIAPRLVLTAAQCVQPAGASFGSGRYEVLAGAMSFGRTRTTTGRTPVQDVYVHPESSRSPFGGYGYGYGSSFGYGFGGWGPYGFGFGFSGYSSYGGPEYDVAVLRLTKAPAGITPIPIVAPGEDAAAWGNGSGRATGATMLGWGSTAHRSRGAERQLHAVGVPIRSDRRCERSDDGLENAAEQFDAETMFCAGVASEVGKEKGACYGDFGGPLIASAADGSPRVVGLVSWLGGNSQCDYWTVLSRVAAMRDWIGSVSNDGGGPGGLGRVTSVRATGVAPNSVRLTWDPPASGTPARYVIRRELDLSIYNFPASLRRQIGLILVSGGATDAIERSLVVEGIEPRRAGKQATRILRVDTLDAVGNLVIGSVVRVSAPIDSRPPARVARPQRIDGKKLPTLRWKGSTDDDCVDHYDVQLSIVPGRWRTNTVVRAYPCEFELRPSQIASIKGVAVGRYLARIIAVDRAGNRSVASRTRAIRVVTRMPRHGVRRR